MQKLHNQHYHRTYQEDQLPNSVSSLLGVQSSHLPYTFQMSPSGKSYLQLSLSAILRFQCHFSQLNQREGVNHEAYHYFLM